MGCADPSAVGGTEGLALHRGNSHSLKPQQIAYLLPGKDYEDADLQQIHTQAEDEADVALLADAWEVTSHSCPLT